MASYTHSLQHFTTGDAFPDVSGPDAEGKLTLLSMRFCPFAQRVHLVLDAKHIDHHVININLKQKPEWLNKFSPLGKVPSLGLTNQPGKPYLHESLVIVDYLDDQYEGQGRLHSADPLRKAIDRLLVEQWGSTVGAKWYGILYKGATDELVDQLLADLDEFETELKNRGTVLFAGDKPGMLDYMIWPWLERLRGGHLLPGGERILLTGNKRFAHLGQLIEAMLQDEAVQKSLLTPEQHIAFASRYVQGVVDFTVAEKK